MIIIFLQKKFQKKQQFITLLNIIHIQNQNKLFV